MKLRRCLLLLCAAAGCASTGSSARGPYAASPGVTPSAYEHYLRARLASESGDHEQALVELRMAAATAGPENAAELRVAMGEELLAAGHLGAARAEAAEATEDFPDDAAAWRLLGRVTAAQSPGEVRDAVKAFERAVTLDPADESTGLQLASAYRQLGEDRRAIEVLGKLVERLPDSAEAHFRLGRALVSTSPERATVELTRAVTLDPDHIDAYVTLAELQRRAGRADAARATLRTAFDRSGADANVGERLFHVLLETGDRGGAATLLRGLDAAWRGAGDRLRLAQFFLELRLPEEALRIAREVSARDASDGAARVLAARALALLGRARDAIAACKEVPLDTPAGLEARAFAADLLGKAGAPQEGLALLGPALAAYPDESQLIVAAASMREQLGAADQARALLDAALARAPADEALTYARASLEERARQPDLAVAIMRRLLDRDRDSVMALNFIGYSYADRNVDLDASERLLKHALELRPDDPYVIDSIGWLALRRGKLDDARAALERAGRLAPFEPEILFHLGELQLRRGQADRARDLFREALALEPASLLRGRLEERLRTLEAKAP